MSAHRFLADAEKAVSGTTGQAIMLPSGLWLLSWGSGAPSGTPTAVYYFRTDTASLGLDTSIYINVNGTWTANT